MFSELFTIQLFESAMKKRKILDAFLMESKIEYEIPNSHIAIAIKKKFRSIGVSIFTKKNKMIE